MSKTKFFFVRLDCFIQLLNTSSVIIGLKFVFSNLCLPNSLADGDVIVIEVIREPLLAQGLLGVLDISLLDEVVVALITCGGELVVLGPWRVPEESKGVQGVR